MLKNENKKSKWDIHDKMSYTTPKLGVYATKVTRIQTLAVECFEKKLQF